MRILAIVPNFLLPSEVWMYRQLQAFAEHTLTVIAYEHHHRSEFPLPGAQIIEVPASHAKPLKGLRKRWDSFTAPDLVGPRFGTAHRRWLTQQILQTNPDVIHCQYGTYGLSTLYVAKPLGVPVVVQFNGHDTSNFIQRQRPREGLIRSLNDFAGIVAVANYQKDWFIAQGAERDRVACIHYGAPRNEHTKERQTSEVCRFLAVGRLCEMKSPLDTIRAFARVHERMSTVRLTIIGDGPLRSEVESLISTLRLTDAIEVLGVQPASVVQKELAKADAFVQHSVTDAQGTMEGWPVAIGEAMMAGLPIVSTRHAGIVDQVIDGENGFLCNEHDWQAMSEGMLTLARCKQTRLRFGLRSTDLALDSEVQCQQQIQFMAQRTSQLAHRRVAA